MRTKLIGYRDCSEWTTDIGDYDTHSGSVLGRGKYPLVPYLACNFVPPATTRSHR